MANTKVTRSQSTAGNRNKWTFSAWVKRASTGAEEAILCVYYDASYYTEIGFTAGDQINFFDLYNGALNGRRRTNALARDCNGWWHIVGVFDKDNATTDEKIRLWVNGVKIEGALASQQQSSISYSSNLNSAGQTVTLGAKNNASYFNGILSHVHFCDGYAYDASYFGSTDSTTGEWKINTSPSVSYGTQGYHILKDGNSVTDQSPNTNNFTVSGGTLTKTEDNPSNVFATINPLFVNDDAATNALTKGNNTYTSTTRGEWNNMTSTLGAITGKYYWEVKYEQLIDASTIYMSSEGVASDLAPANHNLGEGTRSGYGYGWLCGNRNTTSNTRYLKTVNGTATLTTDSNNTPVVAGDIVGVAWDATNGKLWFHKNGTYIDDTSGYVGNPTTAAYPYHTGMQTGILYTVWSDVWQNASGSLLIKSYNFGNGYFGTTAVSSAGTNASGNGIFEYDVPTGYTALSTKGLNL